MESVQPPRHDRGPIVFLPRSKAPPGATDFSWPWHSWRRPPLPFAPNSRNPSFTPLAELSPSATIQRRAGADIRFAAADPGLPGGDRREGALPLCRRQQQHPHVSGGRDHRQLHRSFGSPFASGNTKGADPAGHRAHRQLSGGGELRRAESRRKQRGDFSDQRHGRNSQPGGRLFSGAGFLAGGRGRQRCAGQIFRLPGAEFLFHQSLLSTGRRIAHLHHRSRDRAAR